MDADQLVDSLTEIGFIVYIVSVCVLLLTLLTVNMIIFNDIKQVCILIFTCKKHFCVNKCYFSITPHKKT